MPPRWHVSFCLWISISPSLHVSFLSWYFINTHSFFGRKSYMYNISQINEEPFSVLAKSPILKMIIRENRLSPRALTCTRNGQ